MKLDMDRIVIGEELLPAGFEKFPDKTEENFRYFVESNPNPNTGVDIFLAMTANILANLYNLFGSSMAMTSDTFFRSATLQIENRAKRYYSQYQTEIEKAKESQTNG